jgi:coenzyme F420-reducing hydrogenase delta subunit
MGIGPPGRTGRDQVAAIRPLLAEPHVAAAAGIVVIGCAHGAGTHAAALAAEGAAFHPVQCAGNLHTSVVELLLRAGARGVLVLGCPPRDCWHREGPRWLIERTFRGREAELQARVDRRRVRVGYANAGERGTALAALRAFQKDLASLDPPVAPDALSHEVDTICEPDEVEVRG